MTALHVLVTGATGFIGRRLVPAVQAAGHEVLAMTRHPQGYDGPGEPVGADVADPDSLARALDDVDVAVYLVHALDRADFEAADQAAALAFGVAAAQAGVGQIVYVGGLGPEDEQQLSAHLRSRRRTERYLAAAGVPVTTLRAAVVVGHGGVSWELTRQLVHNLPAMIVPRWATTPTQPIALDDVVRYLAGVIGRPETYGATYEVGGPDQLTYLEMLQDAAEQMTGHRQPILPVPVLTPRLSSYWLALVTDVDVTTGRNLIDSMGVSVTVSDTSIREVVPFEPMSYVEAVRLALAERAADQA